MRLGMLDVGSNTVHLLVADAEAGARPQPAARHRSELRLLDFLDGDRLSDEGVERLVSTVLEARQVASELGVEDLAAFATSALRDAANADDVLEAVRLRTEVDFHVLDGEDEARLTFLAVRRWFGWSAGRILLLDIGGGSLEVAVGVDEEPEHVASCPLGANRLTRDWLPGDPPAIEDIDALEEHVSRVIIRDIRPFATAGEVDLAVGTSKTLGVLARVAGATTSKSGPNERRTLEHDQAARIFDKVSSMKTKDIAKLPGVSSSRAPQLLAGALVAVTAMELLDVARLAICPWALREGVILTRHEWLSAF
jgi:exopolyphosphatase / guanosine-5'-triphosphate,3'-diphosphate pyrophosphatase